MFEEVTLFAGKHSASLQVVQAGIESDLAQGNHHFDFFESCNFTVQKLRALCELLRQWFVIRRSAADGGSDVEVLQLQTIVAVSCCRLIGKAAFIENWIHELAGSISGEWTPRPVGAVGSWSQAHNKDLRFWISEPGHGFAPVLALAISPAFHAGHFLAISHEARAASTSDNFVIQNS